jgi:hypothetical protein
VRPEGVQDRVAKGSVDWPELVEIESFRAEAASLKIPAWLLTHPELRASAAVKAVFQVVGDALAGLFPTKHDGRRGGR